MKNTFFYAGLLASSGALLSACVTINIYFPAAAAEKAADKIIEDVWQLKKPEANKQQTDKAAPAQPAEPVEQPQH